MKIKLTVLIVTNLLVISESYEEKNSTSHINKLKCCPSGTVFDLELFKNRTAARNGKICRNTTETLKKLNNNILEELFEVNIDVISCKNGAWVASSVPEGYYHLSEDGVLYINWTTPELFLNPGHYCFDNIEEDSSETNVIQDLVICVPVLVSNILLINAVCLLVSGGFLLLTLGVYVWQSKVGKLHNMMFQACLACLFVGFLLMAIMQFVLHYEITTKTSCLIFTFIINLSLQSAFFWLNVMCYEMWRGFNWHQYYEISKKKIRRMLLRYAIYAFGLPLLLTILLISLQFCDLPVSEWLPIINAQQCFIYGKSRLLFLFGPISILCMVNIIFFIHLAIRIIKTYRQTSMVNSTITTQHGQHYGHQMFIFCVKLVILMNFNWILEAASAFNPEYTFLSDLYNSVVGFFIFLAFVCKPGVYRDIKTRYKQRKAQRETDVQNLDTDTTQSEDMIEMN